MPEGAVQPSRLGFDAELAGRHAECDGGHAIPGTHFAGREDFAGTLTGEFIEEVDAQWGWSWKWYRMGELTVAPENYDYDYVWCEAGNLYVEEVH